MLLDKLLASVAIRVDPFALCLVDTGWRLRLPGPAEVMFHFVLRGSGTLRGPGAQVYQLERFWLAIVPQGVPHSLECGTPVESERVIGGPPPEGAGVIHLIAGREEAVELQVACGLVRVAYGDSLDLFQHLHEIVAVDLSPYPQVRAAFEGILAEQAVPSPGSQTLTKAYMSQCLVYLLRHLTEAADSPLPWLSALQDTDISRAVDAMLDEPARAHSVTSLAYEALMSRSAFADRFLAAFGCTPMAFLRDVRLRRGAQLLQQGDLPIDQIAHRVGFASRSHFSQLFTSRFGITPAAYRTNPTV